MPRKKQYYDISNMLKTDAQYMILLGERSNGKSYQVKKTIIEAALTGKRFVYLRRWKEDIKEASVSQYFDDMPVKELTKGEWTAIKGYRELIYFIRTETNEEGKTTELRSSPIGYYCALNKLETYKSRAFVNTEYIVYEEFITNKTYIVNEPTELQQFVSTVARDNRIHVLLVGNTLSRVCPYFSEWCLDGVLKQKQGTIDIYHFHVGESVVDIAVEYCANAKSENKMFFGQAQKQIISGEWDTKDVAKLPRPQSEYDCIYEILIEYQKFKFILKLLVSEEGGVICFIYPYTGKGKEPTRKITEKFSDDIFITNRLNTKIRAEQLIGECFRLQKICYSDNLTGADFNNVLNQFHIA